MFKLFNIHISLVIENINLRAVIFIDPKRIISAQVYLYTYGIACFVDCNYDYNLPKENVYCQVYKHTLLV